MGSVFSKKKEPKPEKPKITKQDEEVLVSKSGFHVCRWSRAALYNNDNKNNFIQGGQNTTVIQLMN